MVGKFQIFKIEMTSKKLIFADLISFLENVHSMDELPDGLFDELLNASLAVGFHKLLQNNDYSEQQALEFLKKLVSAHLNRLIEDQG